MSLSATVICLALSLAAGEPAPRTDGPTVSTSTQLSPAPRAPPSGVVNFDELPPPPSIPDDVRVKRFLGAFTGGVVGLGAALALMPLGDGAGCFGAPCVSFVHGLVGTFAPFLALGGAWLGFELMGGDGGLATPAIALAPAILVALGLLSIARETDANTAIALMPYLISSGVMLAGGAALALDMRARQLNQLGTAANWARAPGGRVALTGLVSALAVSGAALISGLLFAAGQFTALGPVMLVAGIVAGTFGAAAAGWGVHRAMNGRGSYWSALASLAIGGLITFGGVALYALSQGSGFASFSPIRNTAGTMLLVQLGVASAILAPTLGLEWSHTNAIEASMPTFSFSASPTPSGGMVAAGMRF